MNIFIYSDSAPAPVTVLSKRERRAERHAPSPELALSFLRNALRNALRKASRKALRKAVRQAL